MKVYILTHSPLSLPPSLAQGENETRRGEVVRGAKRRVDALMVVPNLLGKACHPSSCGVKDLYYNYANSRSSADFDQFLSRGRVRSRSYCSTTGMGWIPPVWVASL